MEEERTWGTGRRPGLPCQPVDWAATGEMDAAPISAAAVRGLHGIA
ncbi:hypothetical protein Poly21_39640 [Allorhodopirellula heiligendammensis]|uniref:Uncharacterized protein n=1 Tax=Allorhodopirellula heiligendammensis TaxID=2714739 RepID=A0A5C6BXY3_9BACT|nr:hypothetical protein Poly21_39640 [Allorhodopirellula heiligendammensis]